MTMLKKKRLERLLKEFNDGEMGGCYIYFVHRDELVQLDMCDYSSCVICKIEDIESAEFIEEDKEKGTNEGLYIEIKDEELDGCWLDENGCQF